MRRVEATAESRVVRVVTYVLGISTVLFLVLSWDPIVRSWPQVNPVWQAASATAVFAAPVIIAGRSPRLSLRRLRRALGAYSIVYAIVVLGFVPTMTAASLPEGLAPWPVLITAIGTVPAALAWRPPLAWVWLVANSLAIAPVRYFAAGAQDWTTPLQFAFYTITFAGMFTGLTIVSIANGKALDTAVAAARDITARAAAAGAQEQEQARLDAIVHDEVISVLFIALQARPELEDSVQRGANQALTHLEELRSTIAGEAAPSPARVPATEFVSRVRSVVRELSVGTDFTAQGERTLPLPGLVARAFAEATGEAMRNSIEHAGPGASRSVRITLDDHRVNIRIADDGVGFELSAVPPHRLGIAVSILARFDAIEGGRSQVQSAPGGGTTVTLDWDSR